MGRSSPPDGGGLLPLPPCASHPTPPCTATPSPAQLWLRGPLELEQEWQVTWGEDHFLGSSDHIYEHWSGAALRTKTANRAFSPKLVEWDGWSAWYKVENYCGSIQSYHTCRFSLIQDDLFYHSPSHPLQAQSKFMLHQKNQISRTKPTLPWQQPKIESVSSFKFRQFQNQSCLLFTSLTQRLWVEFAGFWMEADITGRSTSLSGSLAPAWCLALAHVAPGASFPFVASIGQNLFSAQAARGCFCQHAWRGGEFLGFEPQGVALARRQTQDLHQAF